MKLRFSILSAAAALFCLCAFPSCSQEPSSRVEALNQVVKELALVDSKAAADAASGRVSALLASIENFPETPDENLADAEGAVGRLLSQGMRLSKENFFDSEKLKDALGYTTYEWKPEAPETVPAEAPETVPAEAPESAPAEAPETVPAEEPTAAPAAENA